MTLGGPADPDLHPHRQRRYIDTQGAAVSQTARRPAALQDSATSRRIGAVNTTDCAPKAGTKATPRGLRSTARAHSGPRGRKPNGTASRDSTSRQTGPQALNRDEEGAPAERREYAVNQQGPGHLVPGAELRNSPYNIWGVRGALRGPTERSEVHSTPSHQRREATLHQPAAQPTKRGGVIPGARECAPIAHDKARTGDELRRERTPAERKRSSSSPIAEGDQSKLSTTDNRRHTPQGTAQRNQREATSTTRHTVTHHKNRDTSHML